MTTKLANRLAGIGCLLPTAAGLYFITYAIFNGKGLLGFLLTIGAVVAAIILFMQVNEVEKSALKKQRKELASFKSSEIDADDLPTIISSDALTRVVIDEGKGRLYVWMAMDDVGNRLKKAKENMHYQFFNHSFKDLEAVAVVVDGNALLSRGYRLNPGLENFIHEDTGAVNSAITNAVPNDKVRKMTLLIQMNREKNPIYPIRLYSDPYAYVEKASSDYTKTLESVKMWYDRLNAVIGESEHKRAVAAVQKKTEPEVTKPVQQPAVLGKLARTIEPETVDKKDVRPKEQSSAMIPSNPPQSVVVVEENDNVREPVEETATETPVYPSAKVEAVEPVMQTESDRKAETGEEKELSYFEQLLEKNRKQMNDPPSKRE